jgi:hypothetical protein
MSGIVLAATWAVCVVGAVGTAWLGSASGLFRLGPVGPVGLLATIGPYVVLAVLAWGHRRRPALLGIVFALAILVSGYGLFFFFNDWYWPQPTQPNPWRVWMIPVVIVPQWAVIGLAVVILMGRHLWSTLWRATAEPRASADRPGTS